MNRCYVCTCVCTGVHRDQKSMSDIFFSCLLCFSLKLSSPDAEPLGSACLYLPPPVVAGYTDPHLSTSSDMYAGDLTLGPHAGTLPTEPSLHSVKINKYIKLMFIVLC